MSYEKSRELYERSKKSLAGGVSSNVRLAEKPVPPFFERAKGSKLYDVDGNEYIDYMLGQGPDIFGHAPDFLVDSGSEAMRSGITFAGQHEMEIRVSEAIKRAVPSAEAVATCEPDGSNAACSTASLCPLSTVGGVSDATSQIRALLSSAAVTR